MTHYFINPARLHPPAFVRALRGRSLLQPAKPQPAAYDDESWYAVPDADAPLEVCVKNGIAIINVAGALVDGSAPGWYWYGDITYQALKSTVQQAVSSPDVSGILLNFNSPGGGVIGCAGAADWLNKMTLKKPIWAFCQTADSAAYWLASAAERIVIDPTGEAGSIGVLMVHEDMSAALEEWGITATVLRAGARKAELNPYEPLTEESRAQALAELEYLRARFIEAVAENRGAAASTFNDQQGLVYIGQQAVDQGLADAVMYEHDLLEQFGIYLENQRI
ncbi:MAG: hypothetical protein GC153_13065 [Alphaproteobacteria bacterium]|nr:hypothetical protein [Alphaproteobacteria bacterium]